MRFLQLIAILLITITNCQAQNFENQSFEHKHIFHKPWIGNNQFLTNYIINNGIDTINSPLYAIPIKLWVYKSSDSSQTTNDKYIKQLIQNLNTLHRLNNTHITFYVSEIKYFTNKKYAQFRYYTDFPIKTTLHHNKKLLNISIVESLTKSGKKNRNYHFTGSYNTLSNSVITIAQCHPSGICHETGHYLGLKHPHKSYNRGKRHQESVSRTQMRKGIFIRGYNCEINGDGLSDTYAQPNLNKCVDNNCHYIGTQTDRWGNQYKPQTDNIMSYPPNKNCRTTFTPMQKAVMLYTLENKKKSANWRIKTDSIKRPQHPDRYEPDFSPEIATLLQPEYSQLHTLHQRVNKKGKPISDDYDWLKIDYKNYTIQPKITITIINSTTDNINIETYDVNKKKINKYTTNSQLEIELENCQAKIQFLKVTPEKNNQTKHLEYKINFFN